MPPVLQEAQKEFYDLFWANTKFDSQDFGHIQPSAYETSIVTNPFNEQYDQTGKMLEFIFLNLDEEPMTEWKTGDPNWRIKGVFKKYQQSEFV